MPNHKSESNKVRARGATRMKELGRKKVTLWFSAEEVRLIEAAARRAYKKTATWVREKAFHAAEESDREARRRAKTEEVP